MLRSLKLLLLAASFRKFLLRDWQRRRYLLALLAIQPPLHCLFHHPEFLLLLVDGELPLDAACLRPVVLPDGIPHTFADGVGQSVVFGVFRAVLSLAILEDL